MAIACFRQMLENFVDERILQLARRERMTKLPTYIIGWVGGSVIAITLCVLIGPFGTDNSLSFITRIGYWGVVVLSASIIMLGVQVILAKVLGLKLWHEALIGSLIFATLYVPLLILINGWVFTESSIAFGSTFVSVFVISLLIYSVVWLAHLNMAVTPVKVGKNISVFQRRLSQPPNSILWAIMAEDHYIRVITSTGEEMILMRFSDALSEVVDIDGIQIHRSIWIARAGVKQIVRESGKLTLTLQNDQKVSASRGFTKAAHDFVTKQTNM